MLWRHGLTSQKWGHCKNFGAQIKNSGRVDWGRFHHVIAPSYLKVGKYETDGKDDFKKVS